MNKLNLFIFSILIASSPAQAEICGHVIHPSKTTQMIPVEGKVKVELRSDEAISCGAMIITHHDSVWIELADLTVIKIAPDTFFEFSKKETAIHKLYRGEVLVSAPPSIRAAEFSTPNSISDFQGGLMLLSYSPKSKETSLAVFNRKVVLRNKFHSGSEQVVSVGELSRLWIGDSRIIPTQPELMNPASVKVAVKKFGVSSEDSEELSAVVVRAVNARSKSLVADLETWEEIEKQTESAAERSLASVSGKGKKKESSIDLKEAEIGLQMLKKHLYGEPDDLKMFEDDRKPSSLEAEKTNQKINDREYQRKKAMDQHQVKKLMEDIRGFDPEND